MCHGLSDDTYLWFDRVIFATCPLPHETFFGRLLRFRKFGQGRNTRAADEEEEASAFLFLVNPSDSDTSRMLPTPSVNVVTPVPMDDPLKHQGRIRTTPHVDGQFAAYVYAPILPVQRLQRLIHGIFETIEGRVQNVHRLVHFKSDDLVDESSPGVLTTPPPALNGGPHLSLTRPIYLRAHQRDILKQAVKEVANKVPKCVHSPIQCPRSGHNTDRAQV